MLNPWKLSLIVLVYMGLLFAIAWYGDKQRIGRDHRKFKAIIYALSLAVYCTSWTFYGAVGTAASTGWGFVPIYLGPALMMLLGFDVLRRIAITSRDQRITSIADFIAFRYGRSHSIAVLVTCAAVIGVVPYIALQLKGITTSIDVITRATGNISILPGQLPLYLALTLAVFAMVFGTRNMDASEHHRGLMWAIAFESLVKLLAFIAIGLFAIFGVFDGFDSVAQTMRQNGDYQELFTPWRLPEGFGIQLILGMVAILCLPRQFHVGIVEFRDTTDLRVARWIFPAYLFIFAALVVPIALAGLTQFSGQDVNPDTYVLSLPLAFDQPVLTLLAFLGGFSAATGMVIVSTVALAIMISNDIVMPLLLRSSLTKNRVKRDLSQTLLRVRRISILLLALAAVAYYRAIEAGVPLHSIGLLSFSAAAQFAPAMIIGIYWRGASKTGAIWGLSLGVTSWFILLLLPSFTAVGQISDALGIFPPMTFNQGAIFSLLLNASAIVLVSLIKPDMESSSVSADSAGSSGLITVGDLENTIGRFLGMNKTRKALSTHLGTPDLQPGALASPETIQFGERLLGGSIGSASARTVLSTALHHRGLGPEAVMELLDRTSQAVQFNRELLESTLDNMSQGVSVVDQGLRLVGWNRRYVELMDFPEGTLYIGKSIEDLFNLNVKRGLIEDHKSEVNKRLEHLRRGREYRYERQWLGNKVLEIRGNPMPGGGYVTTFSNITHFKDIEHELQLVNETLEQRVQQRTVELESANTELEKARQTAEDANLSKTRFLAAASHDLLQPMNAASLFVSILRQQQEGSDDEQSRLVKRIDRSLKASEQLLSALLDISKLDSGMYDPEPEAISVPEFFEQLRRRFKALAGNHNLTLRVHPTDHVIFSDRNLLYRILQNFLANAIHYTETGGVLLGCRLRGDHLLISVWDTGVGIEDSEVKAIFQEFHRLDYARRLDEKGLGLGLAICDRISRMLGHTINLSSKPGHGSCFSVTVPLALDTDIRRKERAPVAHVDTGAGLKHLVVLCVDNEPDILEAMNLLLDRWGCPTVMLAQTQAQAAQQVLMHGTPDFVLVDYHLTDQSHGLQVMTHLDKILGTQLPAIVITADRSKELEEAVREQGYGLLRKPIRPAALRALMTNMLKTKP